MRCMYKWEKIWDDYICKEGINEMKCSGRSMCAYSGGGIYDLRIDGALLNKPHTLFYYPVIITHIFST